MSQIPFTPVTAEALERLTEEERAAFTEAAGQVAEGVEPSLAAVAELVAIVQRLITETAPAADGTGWAQDHAHRCLLALQLPPNASGATTLSGYLAELLMTLWADPRAFDAELPFGAGSQGWEDMLYKVAAAASDGTESPLHLVRSAIAKLGEVTP